MALANGPNRDCVCWEISTPRLADYAQFYIGTSMLKKGVYPSHAESQKSHEVA